MARASSPFRRHFAVPLPEFAFDLRGRRSSRDRYGTRHVGGAAIAPRSPADAAWRRIDADWLYSAETLALKLNTGINNTSLVVAFELPQSKKVLFFAADAQRGNWVSWKDLAFKDGDATVTSRDLLARAGALQGRPSRQPQRNARWQPRRSRTRTSLDGTGRPRRRVHGA